MSRVKKKALTLLEIIVAMTIFFVLVVVVTSLFIYLYQIKGGLEARQRVTQEGYFLLEKMQTLLKDYTIDYEEYWNRSMVGCVSGFNFHSTSFQRDNDGVCSHFTAYGNHNTLDQKLSGDHRLYYCSSCAHLGFEGEYSCGSFGPNIRPLGDQPGDCYSLLGKQSYGQYSKLFFDVKGDVDYVAGPVNDDDDVDLGQGPQAISQPSQVQELYLISHDKTKRLLIRRKKYNNGNNGRYGLEMLQLRSFDAGKQHNFSNTSAADNPGIYDGVIDTWACDYSKGYVCKGPSVGGAYANYRLPQDEDDGWVELSAGDVSIEDWSLEIYPLKDPSLARREPLYQQNPYVRVSFTMKLDQDSWQTKISDEQRERYVLPLQTMFSFTPHS